MTRLQDPKAYRPPSVRWIVANSVCSVCGSKLQEVWHEADAWGTRKEAECSLAPAHSRTAEAPFIMPWVWEHRSSRGAK